MDLALGCGAQWLLNRFFSAWAAQCFLFRNQIWLHCVSLRKMSQAQQRGKKQRLQLLECKLRVATARGSILLSFTRELRGPQLCVLAAVAALFQMLRAFGCECKWWSELLCISFRSELALCATLRLTRLAKVEPCLRVCDACQALLSSRGVFVAWVDFVSSARSSTRHLLDEIPELTGTSTFSALIPLFRTRLVTAKRPSTGGGQNRK